MELKLKAVPEKRGVYTTKIKGKDVVMAFFERNRGKAEDKFNSITIRTKALAGARTLATTEKAECYVGVSVSVAGRFSDSWAISLGAVQENSRCPIRLCVDRIGPCNLRSRFGYAARLPG